MIGLNQMSLVGGSVAVLNGFSPLSLFAAGEQGVWYDPSDFSTMFQDSAGTTPVTAVGQSVGLLLDKSQGLASSVELADSFAVETGWSYSGGTLTCTGSATSQSATENTNAVSGKFYYITFTVVFTSGLLQVRCGDTFLATLSSSGTYRYCVAASSASSVLRFTATTPAFVGSISNISVKQAPGNHATQAASGSRPTIQQDANGKYFLLFDGSNDFLVTSNIDFGASNKLSMWLGARKLSSAYMRVIELSTVSASSNGAFSHYYYSDNKAYFASTGTTNQEVGGSVISPPSTQVFSCQADISSPLVAMNENTTAVASNTLSQGTGNFGNYPLYIGSRAGTSMFFNGRLYGAIIRGAASTADQIAKTESWVNQKTSAY